MKTVVILSTLDTKGRETAYLRDQVESLGGRALLFDIGVVGTPGVKADVTREEIASSGGIHLAQILTNPTRQEASPVTLRPLVVQEP